MTRKRIKAELDKTVAKLVKIRDGYTCQNCGKKVERQNCHWAHVLSKGAGGLYLRWFLPNALVLCFHCHIDLGHRQGVIGQDWFRERFPDRMKSIEARAKWSATQKTIRDETLKEWLDEYRALLKEAEKNLRRTK